MKNRHMLSLLQSGYTTLQVAFTERETSPIAMPPSTAGMAPAPWQQPIGHTFQDDRGRVRPLQSYTYKTRDLSIKVGDRVIVEDLKSKTGLTIGAVVNVDVAPVIDVDADFDYKWIVQRVDMGAYERVLQDEAEFNATLQEVERQHQRDELVAKMTAHLPEGGVARTMFDEAIARFAGKAPAQAAIEQAPAPAQQPTEAWAPVGGGVQCK